MDWESINGITGIVSAIGALISASQLCSRSETRTGSSRKILMFILASFSWALLVFIANWLFEPMGAYVSADEERKVFAVALAFPAVVGFYFGTSKLFAKSN